MPRVRKSPTSSAVEILNRRYIAGRPEQEAALEAAHLNAAIAEAIYRLRASAGLTQQQLAKRVGTAHSVISRLEDSDYRGHSLRMLQRVSVALNCRLQIRFLPLSAPRKLSA